MLRLIDQLHIFLKDVPPSRGIHHCFSVLAHVDEALEYETISEQEVQAVRLAALLHEVDDHEFFDTKDYANARSILKTCEVPDYISYITIEMIDLVSCSNHNFVGRGERWKFIPRDADRLEALGDIGILRCYEYTLSIGNPIILPSTPRPKTLEELESVATLQRFENYKGKSDIRPQSSSMIDHYYDKLLHIGIMSSGNQYLCKCARTRMKTTTDFVMSTISATFRSSSAISQSSTGEEEGRVEDRKGL